MKTPKYISGPRLAELTGKHPFRIKETFAAAYVGRNELGNVFEVQSCCDVLRAESHCRVSPSDLFELVDRKEGAAILAELGKPRDPMSFRYWGEEGHIRVIRVGKWLRYVRSEVIEFAATLPDLPHRRLGH